MSQVPVRRSRTEMKFDVLRLLRGGGRNTSRVSGIANLTFRNAFTLLSDLERDGLVSREIRMWGITELGRKKLRLYEEALA